MYHHINKLTFILFTAIGLMFFASCDKDREHPVPYVRVDFNFNITNYNLNSPGLIHQFPKEQYEYGGYQGVIVYRESKTNFRAFDRACPSDPHNCQVNITEENSLIGKCPCCESEFLLIDGTVLDGEARYPLKEYSTSFNPPRLRVTN